MIKRVHEDQDHVCVAMRVHQNLNEMASQGKTRAGSGGEDPTTSLNARHEKAMEGGLNDMRSPRSQHMVARLKRLEEDAMRVRNSVSIIARLHGAVTGRTEQAEAERGRLSPSSTSATDKPRPRTPSALQNKQTNFLRSLRCSWCSPWRPSSLYVLGLNDSHHASSPPFTDRGGNHARLRCPGYPASWRWTSTASHRPRSQAGAGWMCSGRPVRTNPFSSSARYPAAAATSNDGQKILTDGKNA
jgi:hypothetical protein